MGGEHASSKLLKMKKKKKQISRNSDWLAEKAGARSPLGRHGAAGGSGANLRHLGMLGLGRAELK